MEFLLESGFRPRRSFYLAFGHDEEGSGFEGAAAIADTLKRRGVKDLLYLLDEGSVIVENAFPGVTGKVALYVIAARLAFRILCIYYN